MRKIENGKSLADNHFALTLVYSDRWVVSQIFKRQVAQGDGR